MIQALKILMSVCVGGLALLSAVNAFASTAERQAAEAEQARLDQACADARERILSVERAQLVQECVADQFPRDNQADCERFYADHGDAAGNRAPLYMNLPECVTAHDYRQHADQ